MRMRIWVCALATSVLMLGAIDQASARCGGAGGKLRIFHRLAAVRSCAPAAAWSSCSSCNRCSGAPVNFAPAASAAACPCGTSCPCGASFDCVANQDVVPHPHWVPSPSGPATSAGAVLSAPAGSGACCQGNGCATYVVVR